MRFIMNALSPELDNLQHFARKKDVPTILQLILQVLVHLIRELRLQGFIFQHTVCAKTM